MKMTIMHEKHVLPYNVKKILQRDTSVRAIEGRMHFATSDDNQTARQRFIEAMQDKQDLVLTTGCGLPRSLESLPLRFPSLIVPGLEMLKAYQQSFSPERNIHYHVYQASPFIARVNGIEADHASRTSQFMQRYVQAFTKEFYPDLAPIVSFDFNKDVSTEKLEPIQEFLQDTKNSQALACQRNINVYAAHEDKRGAADIYAAANVYFNCMLDQEHSDPVTIIPAGGKKERPFFFLSALYDAQRQKSSDVKVLPVSFNHQERSPCYSYNYGDFTVGDVFKGNKKAFKPDVYEVRKDHDAILDPIGATIPVLMNMVRQLRYEL